MPEFKTILTLLATALLLTACGGGKIPQTHYYALDLPAAPAPAGDPLPHTLVVMPFRAGKMLTQDRIVYRPSREEVGYYEYHRWAQDPRSSVTDAVIAALRSSSAFSSVVPLDGRTRADYMLRGRIDRLEEVDFEGGVKVYVEISAELLDASQMRAIWEGSAQASRAVNQSDMRQVVSAMSAAMDEAIGQLAKDAAGRMNRPLTTDASSCAEAAASVNAAHGLVLPRRLHPLFHQPPKPGGRRSPRSCSLARA